MSSIAFPHFVSRFAVKPQVERKGNASGVIIRRKVGISRDLPKRKAVDGKSKDGAGFLLDRKGMWS
jgi:hypothetical protein